MGPSDFQQVKDYGILGALALFLIKDIWSFLTGSTKKLIEALHENTKAINELKIHVDYLKKNEDRTEKRFDKIDAAVKRAHDRISHNLENRS